jgi:hypothetical protein
MAVDKKASKTHINLDAMPLHLAFWVSWMAQLTVLPIAGIVDGIFIPSTAAAAAAEYPVC